MGSRARSFGAARSLRSLACLLGGSWVVTSRVISPLIGLITIVTLLITPLITTHEPPSRGIRAFEGLDGVYRVWLCLRGRLQGFHQVLGSTSLEYPAEAVLVADD